MIIKFRKEKKIQKREHWPNTVIYSSVWIPVAPISDYVYYSYFPFVQYLIQDKHFILELGVFNFFTLESFSNLSFFFLSSGVF